MEVANATAVELIPELFHRQGDTNSMRVGGAEVQLILGSFHRQGDTSLAGGRAQGVNVKNQNRKYSILILAHHTAGADKVRDWKRLHAILLPGVPFKFPQFLSSLRRLLRVKGTDLLMGPLKESWSGP